jgi:hypothetical protein
MGFRTRDPNQIGTLIDHLKAWERSLPPECRETTGKGTITGLFGTASTVNEIITCVATDATHFTVAGNVSEALGTATVGTPFTGAVCSFTITAGATAWAAGDIIAFPVTEPWATLRTSEGLKYIVSVKENDIHCRVFLQARAFRDRLKRWVSPEQEPQ